MHTAGAGTEAATSVFLFMIGMTGCLCSSILRLNADIFSGTGNAGQHQQVNSEYDEDCLHAVKIMVYKKLCYIN